MKSLKQFLRSPLVSSICGGLVVAIVGLIALNAGWVTVEQSDGTGAQRVMVNREAVSESEGAGKTIGEIYRRDGRGVAFISARVESQASQSPFGFPEQQGGGTATGSGFLIDDQGQILTNQHVVAGATEIEVKLGDSETVYDAELVGEDPATDLALIKIDAPADALFPLSLGDSNQVNVGDPVVAIGNPFGLDRTVTSGIVSALQRQIQAPNGFAISNVIQTDAPINPGNSGGPLIDSQGRVIGVNSQIQTGSGSGGNVGIGFAVPINTARDVIEQLADTGEVKHAYLGIEGATITPDIAKSLNLPIKGGVMVQSVVEDGPADKAGLRAGDQSAVIEGSQIRLGGDIITAVNGEEVTSMDQLITLVNEAKVGDKLKMTALREGDERQVTLTLGTRPDSAR